MGSKERYYFSAGILFALMGFVLGIKWPGSLTGFATVLTPVCGGLYGGALGKLWVESRNGSNGSAP